MTTTENASAGPIDGEPIPLGGDLARVAEKVLAVLLCGPVAGMTAWGPQGLAEHLPGSDKWALAEVLWQLESRGVVSATPYVSQGRAATRWQLIVPPDSLVETGRVRKRDRLGRFMSETTTTE